ncbi:unnamed protein product [Boreogadus saida]
MLKTPLPPPSPAHAGPRPGPVEPLGAGGGGLPAGSASASMLNPTAPQQAADRGRGGRPVRALSSATTQP